MSKPIFLIQCNCMMGKERAIFLHKKLQEQIPDWHILIADTLAPGEQLKFNAYTIREADDIEIEKLKQIVLAEIND